LSSSCTFPTALLAETGSVVDHDNSRPSSSSHRSLQRPPASTHRSRSESRPRSALTTTASSNPSSGKSTPRGGAWSRGAFFSSGSSSSTGGGGANNSSVSVSGSVSGRSTPGIGGGGNGGSSRDSSRSRGRSPFGSFSFFGPSLSNSGSNLGRSSTANNGAKPSTPKLTKQTQQQAGQNDAQAANAMPETASKKRGNSHANYSQISSTNNDTNIKTNGHSATTTTSRSQDTVADRVAAALIASGAGASSSSSTTHYRNRNELTPSPAFSIASSNEEPHHLRRQHTQKAPFAPAKSSPPRAWGFSSKGRKKQLLRQQQQQQKAGLKSGASQKLSQDRAKGVDYDNEEKKEDVHDGDGENQEYDDDDDDDEEEEDLGAEMAAWADANGSSRGPSPALPLPSPAFGQAQPLPTPTPPPPPPPMSGLSTRSSGYSTFSSNSNSRRTSPLRRSSSSSSGATNGAPALSRSNSSSTSNWLSRKRVPIPSNLLGSSNSSSSSRSAMATPDLGSSSSSSSSLPAGAVQAPRKASPPQAWGWGGVGSSSGGGDHYGSDHYGSDHYGSSSSSSGKRSSGGTPLFGASASGARLPSPAAFPAGDSEGAEHNYTSTSTSSATAATALSFSGRLSPALSPDGATTISAATPALSSSFSSTTPPAGGAPAKGSGILSPTQFRAVSGVNQTTVRPPSSSSLAAPSPAPGAGIDNLFHDVSQPRSRSQQKVRQSTSKSNHKSNRFKNSSSSGLGKKKGISVLAPEPLRTSASWGSFTIYQSNPADATNNSQSGGITSNNNHSSFGKPSDLHLARSGSSGSVASLGSVSSSSRSSSHASSSNSHGPIANHMSQPRMVPLSSFSGSGVAIADSGAPSSPVSAPAEWGSNQPLRSTTTSNNNATKKKRSSSAKQQSHKPKGSPVGGSRGSAGSNSSNGTTGSHGSGGLWVKTSAVEKDAPLNHNAPLSTPSNRGHSRKPRNSSNASSKVPASEPKAPRAAAAAAAAAASSLHALLSPPPSRPSDSATSCGDMNNADGALTPKRSPLKGTTSFTTGHQKKARDSTHSNNDTTGRSGSSSRRHRQSDLGTLTQTSSGSSSVASALAAEAGPEVHADDKKGGCSISPARPGGRLPPPKAASRPLASRKRPNKAPPRAASRYDTPT